MARILYWNVENFGINKIRRYTGKRNRAGNMVRDGKAHDRRHLIKRHIRLFDPDIFVMVEVSTGAAAVGSMIANTGGWQGCEFLNQEIQGYGNWNLIPPLVVGGGGRAEGVAVYYKQTTNAGNNLFFTGPNHWSNMGGGRTFDPAVMPAPPQGAYPGYVNNPCFPNGSRAIPPVALYNGNVQENQCAARVEFNDQHGAAIQYNGLRSPYMVTFSETDGGGNIVQNITLFAIHSPPKAQAARTYLNGLADVADIRSGLAANEVKVIVGDFNLNLLKNDNTEAAWYGPLTALGYAKQLRPAGGPPVPLDGYQGYFATHMKRASKASFWNANGVNRFYPAYGYIGSSNTDNLYSIDNILVWGGAPNNLTVSNPVTGVPFNVIPNPVPGNPPIGARAFPSAFQAPPPGWPPVNAPNWAGGMKQLYRQWRNFGHIRSTSDHLALYVEV